MKNEVIEEMNRFRPVDEDQEDLSGRYQQQTQLIKPTKETKFLEVPKKENKKIKKTTRKNKGRGKALIKSVRISKIRIISEIKFFKGRFDRSFRPCWSRRLFPLP